MSDDINILVISAKVLVKNDKTGLYEYKENIDFDGHVEVDGDLGWIKFAAGIYATGHILVKAGSGIEAGCGIKAGDGILTFFRGGIVAKWIIALRVAVGFHLKPDEEIQTVKAELRDGTPLILGIVETS